MKSLPNTSHQTTVSEAGWASSCPQPSGQLSLIGETGSHKRRNLWIATDSDQEEVNPLLLTKNMLQTEKAEEPTGISSEDERSL